jgi:hypothetical protein
MGELQRIWLDNNHLEVVFKKYAETPEHELLTVLWWKKWSMEWYIAPKDQIQSSWSVSFDSQVIWQAVSDLEKKDNAVESISFTHNHNRGDGHASWFSDADLDTAQKLHDEQWIDRMGLVMNGEVVWSEVAVQHFVQANHKWDLHDLHWSEWEGKVVTTYKDEQWVQKIEYFASLEEAEQKELKIVALKKMLLWEDPNEAKIVQMHWWMDYAQAA